MDTTYNFATSKIKYPTINYGITDIGTHYYKIKEVNTGDSTILYSSEEYNVTVKVTDNGDGTLLAKRQDAESDSLDFTNTVVKYVYPTVNMKKTLNGRAQKDQEFIFAINGIIIQNNTLVGEIPLMPLAVNKADGTMEMNPEFFFNQNYLGTQIYVALIEYSQAPTVGPITYSNALYYVKWEPYLDENKDMQVKTSICKAEDFNVETLVMSKTIDQAEFINSYDAEVVNYEDLLREGSLTKAKEKGLVRMEGKDYIVKDGDVILFRFNV